MANFVTGPYAGANLPCNLTKQNAKALASQNKQTSPLQLLCCAPFCAKIQTLIHLDSTV